MQLLPSLLVAAIVVCLCGCGAPGAPQPPSLNIPKPALDLQGVRKGSHVTFTWTAPTETTDGELLRKAGKMFLGRATKTTGPFQTVAEVDLAPSLKAVQRPRAFASDDIAAIVSDPAAPEFLFYHVTAVSDRGRTSPPSNQVAVPTVATLAPPPNLALGLEPRGVTIRFQNPPPPQSATRLQPQYLFRVMRRQSDSKTATEPALVAVVDPGQQNPSVVDAHFEWEKKYEYWVTPVTLWSNGAQKGAVEGDDSPVVSILAHDSFPPATPSGLQAVFSGVIERPGMDLTWTPNSDEDLAGYNVYRRTADGPPHRINTELVKTPAFHDGSVALGSRYWYSVSAVDLRGNESGKSAEALENVPKQ
jgi:hypothetical protein